MLDLPIGYWSIALLCLSTGVAIAILLSRTANLKELLRKQTDDNKNLESRLTSANNEFTALQKKFVDVNTRLAQMNEKVSRIPELEIKIKEREQELTHTHDLLSEAHQKNKVLENKLENANLAADEKMALLERVEKKFEEQFRLTATAVLDENSKKFSEQNKEGLGNLITPLKEQLDKFDKRIVDSRAEDAKERQQVRSELKQIAELGLSFSDRAENLTNALRGDVKTQGYWGEMILETVLEKSGLQKDREYIIQASGKNAEGIQIRPDVVLTLPDNRSIVIDSKVSLKAYTESINAETEKLSASAITQHTQSMKKHILGLSKKNYQDIIGTHSLDFVLMFVPNEPSLTLALKHSPELFDLAVESNIVLVSPNTLMSTLRMIAYIWRTERQNQNAQEIAEQAGLLYDKVVGFSDGLLSIGNRIDQTKTAYDESMKRLKTGNGNIIGRVEKLKSLGAKSSKQMPKLLIDKT